MSEQIEVTSGDTPQPAGGDAGTDQAATSTAQASKDSVQYDTYKKVLGEKKRMQEQFTKAQEELEQMRAAQKQAEEAKLAENQEYKKLLELRTQELEKTNSELKSMRQSHTNAQKLDAFLSALGGKVDKKYWGLIDIDRVVTDPETGGVDEMSVTKLVEDFRAEHGRLIDTQQSKKLPNEYPKVTNPGGFESKSLAEQQREIAELLIKHQ